MMGRTGWVTVALGVALGQAFAAEGPARLVVAEPTFDFGTVERGAVVEHTFQLQNAGGELLRIDHVKSSCGCTVGVASSPDIVPGGEGRVLVRLDTARMTGRKTKTVTVYTNDPAAPVAGLTLSGEVVADLVLAPSPLYFGRVQRGEPVRREVLVTPGRPGEPVTITAVEHANPMVHVHLEPRADAPGQRIVIELDREAPLGRFSDQLTLRTTSAREPVLTLAVFGRVEGDLAVVPPQVTFGLARARGRRVLERELLISNRGLRPVTVTHVAVPAELVTYRLRTVLEGQTYRLLVRLREGLRPGRFRDAIEIFTDHPDERRLVVPLYAIVPAGRDRGRA